METPERNAKCVDCAYFECCEYYDWDAYDEYIIHHCVRHPEASIRIDEEACEDFKKAE